MRFTVLVPALPQRVLSSNAGARSRRNPWQVAESVGLLKGEVVSALLAAGDLPHFGHCSVTVTTRITKRRPKAEECPRCVLLMRGGDYPTWAIPADRTKPLPCCCLRATDPGNGAQPLKPVLDAITFMEVWTDDSYKYLDAVTLKIEIVDSLEDEGLLVVIEGTQTQRT